MRQKTKTHSTHSTNSGQASSVSSTHSASSVSSTCQNCRASFVIDASDFTFYERIHVPAPTFCPECRMIRKMTWRNERSLYRRRCDAPEHNEALISMYPESSIHRIYDHDYWWSDKWDPLKYGKEYDFKKPFFSQLNELINEVPAPHLIGFNNPGTNYLNFVSNSKNCYLLFGSGAGGKGNEDCYYGGNRVDNSRHVVDAMFINNMERCYEILDSENCANVTFGSRVNNCYDSAFLYDCKNCSYCFGCIGLRNKNYHIFNEAYSKEDYEKRVQAFNVGSYAAVIKIAKEFQKFILRQPHKYAYILHSQNTTGDTIFRSKNAVECFNSWDLEDAKRLLNSTGSKTSYDGISIMHSELAYECNGLLNSHNSLFDIVNLHGGQDSFYSYFTQSCRDIFGCVSVRNKQYCILNKQYSKDEYEKLISKIIEHMNEAPYIDKKGREYKYGEFFPSELSPFAYNETIAQEYFPLTKEEAVTKGYAWKDPEGRNYHIQIPNNKLPDHIKDVTDDIVGKNIQCLHNQECNEQCTQAFKIIPDELQFYRNMNLPLPRLCPNCRHYQRLKQRNPLKLWHRRCMCNGTRIDADSNAEEREYENTAEHFHGENNCPNEFETSYAPERKEIVYCESCYNSEVV